MTLTKPQCDAAGCRLPGYVIILKTNHLYCQTHARLVVPATKRRRLVGSTR
jgi:hypothetical protein